MRKRVKERARQSRKEQEETRERKCDDEKEVRTQERARKNM